MHELLKKDPGHRYEVWIEKKDPLPDGGTMLAQTIAGWALDREAKELRAKLESHPIVNRVLVFDRYCEPCNKVMTHVDNTHLVCPGCANGVVMGERKKVPVSELEMNDLLQPMRPTVVVHLPTIRGGGVLGELGGVVRSQNADCLHLEWEDWNGQRRCIGCSKVVGLSASLTCQHKESKRPDGSSVCTKCGAEWNVKDAKRPIGRI